MSKTTKSPKQLLHTAYSIGQKSLPLRWHKFSPKTFSPAQLFACLVLKAFYQLDYRATERMLRDFPAIGAEIGLTKAPDHTTLCKAEKRLLDDEKTQELLRNTIKQSLTPNKMRRLVELAAIDGSGFESRHISQHYLKRQNLTGKEMPHKKHPKLSILVDTKSHLVLSMKTSRGPKPDIVDFDSLLEQAVEIAEIQCLVADKGYDSEKAHEVAREKFDIETLIPPRLGWKYNNPPTGKYRSLMAKVFPSKEYGQRWQVETVFSMVKRLLRSSLTARNYLSQCREMSLRVLTLNIMILRFYAL